MPVLSFITGSSEKFAEAALIIPDLARVDLDLPEIQELDARQIVETKIRTAAASGLENIIVEDSGLYFKSLAWKLPGPLVKWFVKSIGNQGLVELAKTSPQAFAMTTIGYLPGSGQQIKFFEGRLDGSIVAPRGAGFGWDAIFQPSGLSKTLGELSIHEKTRISHRGNAFRELHQSF